MNTVPMGDDTATAQAANAKPTVAIALAGKQKRAHNGPLVHTLAFECCGRLGSEGLYLLAKLAKMAADLGKLQPGTGKPRRLAMLRLRADEEAHVVFATTKYTLRALGVVLVSSHRVDKQGCEKAQQRCFNELRTTLCVLVHFWA